MGVPWGMALALPLEHNLILVGIATLLFKYCLLSQNQTPYNYALTAIVYSGSL